MQLIWIALVSCIIHAASTGVEYKEILAIVGNFSLNGKLTNVAQYDITSGR